MKIKKKVIGGILAVTIFGAGLFGGKALGNSSWSTSALNKANADLVKTGKAKTDELASKTDLNKQMQTLIQPEIEAQQAELARLLEEYYLMKLDGLTETAEYKDIEKRISDIKNALLSRYKDQIDTIFE